ncbi:hypothetical protein Ae406Ps2_0774 [Pseudonocardia sp. Ae406_Ps2]|uniref:hypothetical protein n=1 Tax=unclassified Pseudonocardia TaxID=2619320 RepID=UPI00094B5481|nr:MULTISPECIES: hypothetical protein [unclassified Pseudonocardia]OLM00774.1 hypothetical protein Ae406Ps2_0774 [Pseudonocardia sp. Ae406_Ps2]OLM07436.1 hypothetical protein Ae331Ps2_5146c [Pseudonocardia sp. Ae331_Ps2]OLM14624.1 hypothetical protein Ae505Ps2_4754c [Pseudonocardia sp. Ae505_Ps2]OLM22351.1 hypothetical protein Ae706Ps2_0783 [Pseudonocardia sp. Ae706_Ps2]OLM31781.1 hypothetical protein Ae717Ps2_2676c [Pseudonocardia sp. Ae717_Ps2]
MTSRVPSRRRRDGEVPAPVVVTVLRERLYGTLSCLSTLLVLLGHGGEGSSAGSAIVDVVVAAGALWAASLLSDVVAHLTVHGHGPRGHELVAALRSSGQILQASAAPVVLLVAAAVGLLELTTALELATGVTVLVLALFAVLAARRTPLSWWRRVLLVVALVGLGALVIVVKLLAHG